MEKDGVAPAFLLSLKKEVRKYDTETLIEYSKPFLDVCIDQPFAENPRIVLRHRSNRKWFAMFLEVKGFSCVNLKCEPMRAQFLRWV